MARNIEIKARVRDLPELSVAVAALSDTPPRVLRQHDCFYCCEVGRLKLRRISDDGPARAELIHYQRPDQPGPKLADYRRVPVTDPEGLDAILRVVLGRQGEVRKIRQLYFHGQTRIHLDSVAGLGEFLELEVVLRDHQSIAEGEHIARELMTHLGVDTADLLEGAYLDLLEY